MATLKRSLPVPAVNCSPASASEGRQRANIPAVAQFCAPTCRYKSLDARPGPASEQHKPAQHPHLPASRGIVNAETAATQRRVSPE